MGVERMEGPLMTKQSQNYKMLQCKKYTLRINKWFLQQIKMSFAHKKGKNKQITYGTAENL